jgi:hypothetical protein
MSSRPFRERAFRGAKIEDTIKHFEKMAQDMRKNSREAENGMRVFYEAQAIAYEAALLRLQQEFKYETEKV